MVEFPGLLQSKTFSSAQLDELLRLCANPSKSDDQTRIKAGEGIKIRLRALLKEIRRNSAAAAGLRQAN